MKKEIERSVEMCRITEAFLGQSFLKQFCVFGILLVQERSFQHFTAAGCASSGQTMWFPPLANQTRPSLLSLGLNSTELKIPALPACLPVLYTQEKWWYERYARGYLILRPFHCEGFVFRCSSGGITLGLVSLLFWSFLGLCAPCPGFFVQLTFRNARTGFGLWCHSWTAAAWWIWWSVARRASTASVCLVCLVVMAWMRLEVWLQAVFFCQFLFM